MFLTNLQNDPIYNFGSKNIFKSSDFVFDPFLSPKTVFFVFLTMLYTNPYPKPKILLFINPKSGSKKNGTKFQICTKIFRKKIFCQNTSTFNLCKISETIKISPNFKNVPKFLKFFQRNLMNTPFDNAFNQILPSVDLFQIS